MASRFLKQGHFVLRRLTFSLIVFIPQCRDWCSDLGVELGYFKPFTQKYLFFNKVAVLSVY